MFRVTDSMLYRSNRTWGEDRLFFGRNCCGVIDGATPIDRLPFGGYMSQAEWLADRLKAYLEDRETITDFPVACSDFMRSMEERGVFRGISRKYNYPAATIAAAVEKDGTLSGYVLGDSGILVFLKDRETRFFSDSRVSAFSGLTLEAMNRAAANGEETEKAVRKQKIRNRRKMNTKNGFWTVAPVGDFTGEFLTFTVPAEEVEACILFTDGLEQACDLCDIRLETLRDMEQPSREIIRGIRNLEDSGSAKSDRYVKKIDDVGFIVLKP